MDDGLFRSLVKVLSRTILKIAVDATDWVVTAVETVDWLAASVVAGDWVSASCVVTVDWLASSVVAVDWLAASVVVGDWVVACSRRPTTTQRHSQLLGTFISLEGCSRQTRPSSIQDPQFSLATE